MQTVRSDHFSITAFYAEKALKAKKAKILQIVEIFG